MSLFVVSRTRMNVVGLKSILDSNLSKKVISSSLRKDRDGRYAFTELGVIEEIIGGCGAGRAYTALQPDVTLTPFVYMPEVSLGNVLTDDFDYLWNNHPLIKTLRNYQGNACRSCPYFTGCGGCRAREYQYFNDFLAPDPGCIFKKEHYYRFMEAKMKGEGYLPENPRKIVA